MFNKKKCANCSKKFKSSFDFCPHCGARNINFEDYGMLGLEDNLNAHQPLAIPQKQTLIDSLVGKMVESAFSMIEKEMQKDLKDMTKNDKWAES